MSLKRNVLTVCVIAVAIGLPAPARTKKGSATAETTGAITAVLWREPADLASRNLFYGAGGKKHEPHGPFTFVKEDLKQFNPKFVVRDRDGVEWKVKLGTEARPETAATRLVWAVGYFTTEDYLVPEMRVENMPRLKRGQNLVGPDGVIRIARLKREQDGLKKIGSWEWKRGPFSGTRQLNGLRVMMSLVNNWDLKDENNAVYLDKKAARSGCTTELYMVSDLGASFGTTGLSFTQARSKGNLAAYSRSRFIRRVTPSYVDFSAPSRPNLLAIFQLPYFISALRMRWIGAGIPVDDARWIGGLLGRISPEQVRDAFRAAGYAPDEVEAYTAVVERRIAALNEL